MKRVILSVVAVVLLCGTTFAWDRRAHATTAKIAENHLTPKAKAYLDKYLNGKSIVYYASYADDYKSRMLMELDFQPANADKRVTYPHTFEANADFSVFKGMRRGDDFVKNCVYRAEQFANDLTANHKSMNDSLRHHKIVMLVHWLGDMHCPAHIRYPDDQTIGNYEVIFGSKKIRYHKLWDGDLFAKSHPWSFSDAAYLLDTCTPKEIAEITKGDLYDWGKSSATASRPVHEVREGTVLNVGKYVTETRELMESQIRNGGYRMAKLFNEIFE